MTPVLFAAVAMTGAFAFTFTLWVTGFSSGTAAPTARLMNLRSGTWGPAASRPKAPGSRSASAPV